MSKYSRFISLLTIASILIGQTLFAPMTANATSGTLTVLSDTMSRLKKSVASSHVIKFRTSVAVDVAADTITVTFPADFNLTTMVISDLTFQHGSTSGATTVETLAASADGTNWGAAFSTTQNRLLTLTAPTDGTGAGALAANDYVIITDTSLTHAINPTSSGASVIRIAIAGANTASGSITVAIIDDDQVAVTATVDAALAFSISTPTVGFGTLGTAIRYATSDSLGSVGVPGNDLPVKLVASGNGSSGLSISVQDQGSGAAAGLYNTVETELIPAAASRLVTATSKTYGVYAKNASTLLIDEGFNDDTVSDLAISRTAQRFAYIGSSGGGSVDLVLKAAADATTKPGSYADTLTLICTGLF